MGLSITSIDALTDQLETLRLHAEELDAANPTKSS
jgi:hypothetical protein